MATRHELQEDSTLSPGTHFRDFTLVRELGSGAFAQVFLATQSGVANREVVLKFTTVDTVEIDRLGRLQHSNIVPILSVHGHRRGTVVCMPYLGDATLADLIHRAHGTAAVDADDVVKQCINDGLTQITLRLAIELASGLQHAHSRDIAHGDIKPANILLACDGTPLLLDFNLAGDLTSLRPEVVGGTLRYMPPEHKRAFESGVFELGPDVRSDIYSLGVVLTEVLAGTTTPDDETFASTGASPAMVAILRKCTDSDIDQRYQSCDELLDDLQRQRDNLPLKHQPEPSIAERFRKWARRHPRLTSGVSLFSIFAAITGVLCILLITRTSELGRTTALREFDQFSRQVPGVCSLLSIKQAGHKNLVEGLDGADKLLASVQSGSSFAASPLLPAAQRKRQHEEIGQLLYFKARGQWMLSRAEGQTRQAELEVQAEQTLELARTWFADEVGQTPQAIDVLGKYMRDEPVTLSTEPPSESPTEQLLYSQALINNREFRRVLDYLDRKKSRFAGDIVFWGLMAEGYEGLQDYSKMDVCLTTALSIDPDSWIALTDRGLARSLLGEHDAALADFSKVIKMRPDYYGGYLNRARTLIKQGKNDLAIEDLSKAIELGGPTRLYFLRRRCHLALRQTDLAQQDYQLGLSKTPTDVASWNALALARTEWRPKPIDPQLSDDEKSKQRNNNEVTRKEVMQQAIADLRQALKLDLHDVDTWRNLAYIYDAHLGDAEASRKALDSLIVAGTTDAGTYSGRAVLLARAGEADQAISDQAKAGELNQGRDPMITYQRACVFALLTDESDEYRTKAFALLADSVPKLSIRYVSGVVRTDPDLERIQKDRRFTTLVSNAFSVYQMKNPPKNSGKSR